MGRVELLSETALNCWRIKSSSPDSIEGYADLYKRNSAFSSVTNVNFYANYHIYHLTLNFPFPVKFRSHWSTPLLRNHSNHFAAKQTDTKPPILTPLVHVPPSWPVPQPGRPATTTKFKLGLRPSLNDCGGARVVVSQRVGGGHRRFFTGIWSVGLSGRTFSQSPP
ncbi:hypothetical protein AVEN_123716-1 [Araneus ventricosus]|uniref:Uncharacterized protein n=1 Tax=Araneus ventricosus TaxID=182803 RepID=A0A4Y2R0I4_ARAVE|nr:hypothetical protein AVEN_113187-1 [Araneus ventricosus]GBN69102.1 hypothetical protein AVEN_123716-1 [Araneus ventricosus]